MGGYIKMCKKFIDNRILGLCKETYKLIFNVVNRDYRRCLHSRGRKYKFGPRKMLEIFLKRLRFNDTFERISNEYNISKSSAYRIYNRILLLTLTIKEFRLSAINKLESGVYIVDTTIIRINRSGNDILQQRQYSGKHKQHCCKIQIIIRKDSKAPEAVSFTSFGSIHDYNLFKNTIHNLPDDIIFIADSGYQGLEKLIPGSKTPIKQSKYHQLSEKEKLSNKKLSQSRILIENTNSYIKRFKILSTTYRGNLKQLEKIVKLIAGIARYELLNCSVNFCFYFICGTTLMIKAGFTPAFIKGSSLKMQNERFIDLFYQIKLFTI